MGDGLAIIESINLMRARYHVRIDTAILGYAYSMGAIVAQAGDTRSIGRFGTLMLHSSEWTISGEDAKVFKDYQRLSEHYQEVVAALFAARTRSSRRRLVAPLHLVRARPFPGARRVPRARPRRPDRRADARRPARLPGGHAAGEAAAGRRAAPAMPARPGDRTRSSTPRGCPTP